MFTDNYSDKASRLAASCEKYSLAYELHEVPAVHSSISASGCSDPSCTKANFILHLLEKHRKPVLYVDCDCEFVAPPRLILELARSNCDFAIYNWLADDYTDTFRPIRLSKDGVTTVSNRYYRYNASVDWYDTTQLVCSGLVQFYRNSLAAHALLRRWQRTVLEFPGCADDQCLDFTYNNLGKYSWLYWFLKARWLPKAYARIAFWIYAEPIINHPELPALDDAFARIRDPAGRQRRYESRLKKKNFTCLIPRDCIVDTQEGMLYRHIDGKFVPVERTEQKFWL